MIRHLYLYFLFIPAIIFVYFYNKIPQEKQVLNNKIIWNICGWNLAHVFSFFFICLYVFPSTFYDYLEIIIFMLVWFFFEAFVYLINSRLNLFKINYDGICNKEKKDEKKCDNQIYSNPYTPRLDDLLFNFIGVFLFIIFYYFYYNLNK